MSLSGHERIGYDAAPGFMDARHRSVRQGVQAYLIGLALSALLTAAAFYLEDSGLVWGPAVPVALSVLAVAQIGVHLAFFLHLTTAPDNVNNALALAFGTLIVTLVIGGSLWIMYRLNANMTPMEHMAPPAQVARPEGALTLKGVVEPMETPSVAVGATGLIQSVDCAVGMRVKAGQLCAKIDPSPLEAAVSRNTSALQAAEAQLRMDEGGLAATPPARQARRARALRNAQARIDRDQAKVAELKTAIDAAKANLANTAVVAPVDGIVERRNAEVGQEARPDPAKPLFVFRADKASVFVTAPVSENAIAAARPGRRVPLVVEQFPGKVFSGVIARVAPPARTGATAELIVAAPNPDEALKPGMAATISLPPEAP
jgi:cytochrome o ubiquinol oxidase subunit IV